MWCVPSMGQIRNTGYNLPAELWIVDPDRVQHTLKDGELVSWILDKKIPIAPNEFIHFKLFNPNGFRGLPPYRCIKDELNADYSSGKYNRIFFENNATPDSVIEVDKEKNITVDELRKLKALWNSNHQGVDNAHKTAFLLGGMTYRHMGMSQKEMDFINSRQFNRQTILSVYGVPTFVAGFTDKGDVNRSTAQAAMELFWKNTLKPQLTRIEEKLRVEFFLRFAPELDGRFDYSQISELRQDLKASMEDALKLQMLGYSTNEINRRLELNMPESTDLDLRYTPSNLMPFEIDEPDDDIVVEPKSNREQVSKAIIIKAQREAYKRTFADRQSNFENKFAKKIKNHFYNLRVEALRMINNNKGFDLTNMILLQNLKQLFMGAKDNLVKNVTPVYTEVAQEAGDLANSTLGIKRPFVVDEVAIAERTNKIVGMQDVVFDNLKTSITEGVRAGETVSEIATRVKSVFNTTSNRAMIIARTETASLMNAQTNEIYKNEGIKKKEWAATAGARDSHARLDGEIRLMNESFSNGLMYPGDPSGDAAECVNCRCCLNPIIE
jgi:HK97 family phage portal protein